MKSSESIIKIVPALLGAQKLIGSAKKEADNPFFHHKYADLGSVMEACKEHLNANGITVLQPVMGTVLETILLHESGEWMASETPIVCQTANDPQKLGSAISYARRYGLQSMMFIPAEDDDANTASNKPVNQVERPGYYLYSERKVVPATPPETVKSTGTIIYASEKQVQLIAILLKMKGQRDEDLKAKYHVSHKKELSKVQASQIIDNLSKLPDVAKEKKTEEPA